MRIIIVLTTFFVLLMFSCGVEAHRASNAIEHSTVRDGGALTGDISVYAAPHILTVGDETSPDTVLDWLRKAGEGRVDHSHTVPVGSYAFSPRRGELTTHPRNTDFAMLSVRWKGGRVASIMSGGKAMQHADVEPEAIATYSQTPEGMGQISVDRQLFATASEFADSRVKSAILAVEDKRFEKRKGALDIRGIARSAWRCVTRPTKRCEGGSTIWQQLARQSVLRRNDRTVSRKVNEAFVARQLAKEMPKEAALLEYANTVYVGSVHTSTGETIALRGYKAAALALFGKHSLGELTWPEAAALVSLASRPVRLERPKDHVEAYKRVLAQIHALDKGCPEVAPFPKIRRAGMPDITDAEYVWGPLLAIAKPYTGLVRGDSRRVYLSANSDWQRIADRVLVGSEGGREERFSTLIVMDPETGHVLALAGKHPKNIAMNLATDPLPWASTGKPFVLAAAIQQTGGALNALSEVPLWNGFIGNWPDVKHRATGELDERSAIASSNDAAAIAIGKEIGLEKSCDAMTRAFRANPTSCPSTILLGQGKDVSAKPLEVAAGFAALVEHGQRPTPSFRLHDDPHTEAILSPQASFITLQMLRSVSGDAPSAAAPTLGWAKNQMQLPTTTNVAAKTGTSDDRRELWTAMMFKGAVIVAVVAANRPMPEGSHGASVAGVLAVRFAREALQTPEGWRLRGYFEAPDGVREVEVNRRWGCLQAGTRDFDWFIEEHMPPSCTEANQF